MTFLKMFSNPLPNMMSDCCNPFTCHKYASMQNMLIVQHFTITFSHPMSVLPRCHARVRETELVHCHHKVVKNRAECDPSLLNSSIMRTGLIYWDKCWWSWRTVISKVRSQSTRIYASNDVTSMRQYYKKPHRMPNFPECKVFIPPIVL